MIGEQQVPLLEYGALQVYLTRGEAFSGGARPAGNQSIAYARGGQAAVAVWNTAGVLGYTAIFPRVPDADKLALDTFFGVSQVNYMEKAFTYYPNANKASTSYSMRLSSPDGYQAQEAKSGGNRRLWTITIRMREEVS
jgi:hypothetical protein